MTTFKSLIEQAQNTSLGQTLYFFSEKNLSYDVWKDFLDRLPWDERVSVKTSEWSTVKKPSLCVPSILIASQRPMVLDYFKREPIHFLNQTNVEEVKEMFQQSMVLAIGLNEPELVKCLIEAYRNNSNNYSSCWGFLEKDSAGKSWLINALTENNPSWSDLKMLAETVLNLINTENHRDFNRDFWELLMEYACEQGNVPFVEGLLQTEFNGLTESDWCRLVDAGEGVWGLNYIENNRFDLSRANNRQNIPSDKSYAVLVLKGLNSGILDERIAATHLDMVAEKLWKWKDDPTKMGFHFDDEDRQNLLYPMLVLFSSQVDVWKPRFSYRPSCDELVCWIRSNNSIDVFLDRINWILNLPEDQKTKFQKNWVDLIESNNFFAYYGTNADQHIFKAAMVSHLLETNILFKNKTYDSSKWQAIRWIEALAKAEKDILEYQTQTPTLVTRKQHRL